ncbi:sulfur oxidation c-type cytochrome SoxA [Stappia sp. GBMRC 2046]|uniref:SoxAX cytochrome complex subunit A n=1 Tax=Stappia sediminis TaxID=2692190 RepID=A0A7X3S897_9HYPH|nr:sulfur oxidation c-type cytochrome SoxA [Stappia sediminis]MXN65623.1 sulfur oxidation c-type cytochrome SoxA [Stappia sediminis]
MPFKVLKNIALLSGAALALSGAAAADPDDNKLIIDGEEIATDAAAPEGSPFDRLYSGWRFRTSETQDLQADDFENPGFAAITLGEELWDTVEGSEGKSCASCHGDVSEGMKGVRANMPKWSEAAGKPQTLENHINTCRTDRMGADAWKWESEEMLAMTALVGLQSRGMPTSVQTDGPMQEWWEKGKDLYYTRVGQLDMACANCHEANFGKMIRADHLSQGQINGFPVYRLKWGGLGSIHRRFKGCMENVRAEPFKRGSDEFIALELYVASRGEGLSVETPSVRN